MLENAGTVEWPPSLRSVCCPLASVVCAGGDENSCASHTIAFACEFQGCKGAEQEGADERSPAVVAICVARFAIAH